MAATNINDLPNEILQQMLFLLPPLSLPSFQLVSRRFSRLVNRLIWRRLCMTRFKYWNPDHCIEARVNAKVDETDWKVLYAQRHLVDRFTTTTLDSILSSQTGRIEKFQLITANGYDAKDSLLQHCRVGEDVEDVLARRYYSDAVLGSLHRSMAIREWSRLQRRELGSLERIFGAFDMFVLHDRIGDFEEISSELDIIAKAIRIAEPEFDNRTCRQKSLFINQHLRTHHLTGLRPGASYRDLRNAFLGIALCSEEHNSIPLISTAIFCCVAERLGVDAAPCPFPFHVIAIVTSPPGFDLDGAITQTAESSMYLDPFESSSEISAKDLKERLDTIRVAKANYNEYLSPASIEEIVLRNGRNVIGAVQDLHQQSLARQTVGNAVNWSLITTFPDLESAFYGALWVSLLFGIPPDGDGPVYHMRRREFLPHIIEQFETNYPHDVSLIEQHILPLFQHTGEYAQLRESVRVTRSVDSMPKAVKRRSNDVSQRVRYRIGQVFAHKRYHYQAIITGWDMECGADEHWMLRMRVHELTRGKQQSFYHVLVEDKSVRYVAEENIVLLLEEVSPALMGLAGRHFKRWDSGNNSFVSNVRDEYPDD